MLVGKGGWKAMDTKREDKDGPDIFSPRAWCIDSWLVQCTRRNHPCLLLVGVLMCCHALPPYPRCHALPP